MSPQRLERLIIDELRQLHDAARHRRPILQLFIHLPPVQEMVVVDHPPAEIDLTDNRDVILVEVVGVRADEPIAEAGFPDSDRAFRALVTGQADDSDVEGTVLEFLARHGGDVTTKPLEDLLFKIVQEGSSHDIIVLKLYLVDLLVTKSLKKNH